MGTTTIRPFPMWAGRANEQLTHVVMACLGVPLHGDVQRERALQAMRSFNPPDGPRAHNKTHHTDSSRCDNLRLVGYRKDPNAYCRWLRSSGAVEKTQTRGRTPPDPPAYCRDVLTRGHWIKEVTTLPRGIGVGSKKPSARIH